MATTLLAGSSASTASDASRAQDRSDSVLIRYDQFAPPGSSTRPDAVTYNTRKVPEGADIRVTRRTTREATTVGITVRGLRPHRTYGTHVHTKPCGIRPDDSGPHYQHVKDPVQPSTNPRYANPRNEVWLDFTTDGKGTGTAVARHKWHFRPGEARSIVLHETATHTGPGHAGQAGARLACVTVPLSAEVRGR